jgi:hypothetical protein
MAKLEALQTQPTRCRPQQPSAPWRQFDLSREHLAPQLQRMYFHIRTEVLHDRFSPTRHHPSTPRACGFLGGTMAIDLVFQSAPVGISLRD